MSTLLDDSLVIVLAGGAGERLYPLTKDRAKPAVYFGGPYRIIDFSLSNCINSGLRRIFIATQYKSLSLNRHIRMGWGIVSEELGEFVEILPPQKRVSEHWYQGTADAVYQNLYSIMREGPRYLIVLSGDHVYKMDYSRMLRFHQERAAAVTLATIEVPVADANRFGIIAVDETERVTGFQEKPKAPSAIPGAPPSGAGVLVPVLRREQEGGEVLARHRHARRLLRGQHGSVPGEPRVQSVRSRMAAAHLSAAGAARQIRFRGNRHPLRTGTRLGHLARLHRVGQQHLRQRAVP